MPGAFEIPQAARAVAETGRFDAVVCLGCLIRGATPHFEYISSAVAHGLTAGAGETGVPMAFGVLTTDTVGAGGGARGRRAATTRGGRRRPRRSRWRCCSARCAPRIGRQSVASRDDDGRRARAAAPRARGGAADAVPVGGRPRQRARGDRDVLASREREPAPNAPTTTDRRRLPTRADVRERAGRRHRRPSRRDRRADRRRTRRTGGSSGWPCSTGWCCGWRSTSC